MGTIATGFDKIVTAYTNRKKREAELAKEDATLRGELLKEKSRIKAQRDLAGYQSQLRTGEQAAASQQKQADWRAQQEYTPTREDPKALADRMKFGAHREELGGAMELGPTKKNLRDAWVTKFEQRQRAGQKFSPHMMKKYTKMKNESLGIEEEENVNPIEFPSVTADDIPPGFKISGYKRKDNKYYPELESIATSGNYSEDERKNATVLRKEFDSAAVSKDFQVIRRSQQGLEAAYKMSIDPNIKSRIAADQTLGVMFQKMLDPDSVVRESEYARTPEGASFMNRMKSIAPQLEKGGLRLADEDRSAIIEMTRKLLGSSAVLYNEHYDRFDKLTKGYGVDRELVFGGIERFDMPEQEEERQVISASDAKKNGAVSYNEETGEFLNAENEVVGYGDNSNR